VNECRAFQNDEPFFVNKSKKQLKCGKAYVNFCERQLGVRLTISTTRKIMETAINSKEYRTVFSESERNTLSQAMLHAHNTALRHYVIPTALEKSTEALELWKKFRNVVFRKIEQRNKPNTFSSTSLHLHLHHQLDENVDKESNQDSNQYCFQPSITETTTTSSSTTTTSSSATTTSSSLSITSSMVDNGIISSREDSGNNNLILLLLLLLISLPTHTSSTPL
jgi:hypothetical protein